MHYNALHCTVCIATYCNARRPNLQHAIIAVKTVDFSTLYDYDQFKVKL